LILNKAKIRQNSGLQKLEWGKEKIKTGKLILIRK